MKKSLSFILFFFYYINFNIAQTYELEQFNYNELRNRQLINNYDANNSFSVRYNKIVIDSANSKKLHLQLLPFLFLNQFNSKNAYGWNDGPIRQVNNYQSLLRAGLKLKFRVFEAQFAPEILYVQSTNDFKTFLGQSFVKANLGSFSLGVSSENLWWGPAVYSSLIMSNNAPGFAHVFFRTNKPIKTFLGPVEFNLIGARLESNSLLKYENGDIRYGLKNDNWRYLNSYVISWNPKWLSGLFLGITRSMQQYGEQLHLNSTGFAGKYLPVLGLSVQKQNNIGDDTLSRDQLASFFLRWVLPKSNAEFYLEYGKNDYGYNIRDYLMAPSHSYAYTVGTRKILPKTNINYIQLEAEITQMSQSPDQLVRDAGNWYVHWQIYQGYTHQNQIMGAGAGFGANVQTASATWINGDIRNGFLIQRVERDPVGRINKWTDLSIGWMPQWKYKNLLLGAKVQLIRSNNYNWEKGNHCFNLHSRLMIQYNFK